MEKLVKILSVVAIIFLGTTDAFAQRYGFKLGANLANMKMNINSTDISSDNKIITGMHLGPIAEFSLNDMFSIETGILGSLKGYKSHYEETILNKTFESTSRLYLLYIDVPLIAKVGFKVGKSKIYVDAGPYMGIAAMGKNINISKTDGATEESTTTDMKFGNTTDSNFKRLDFGLTAGAGIEIGAVQISASYGLGLANLAPKHLEGFKATNKVIGISMGFLFGDR